MYSIGEFSRITGLTIKTLRFYHEQGLLVPSSVDDQTGYRYYADNKIETARAISLLRSLDFSLDDIQELLGNADDLEVLDLLERQKQRVREQIRNYRRISQLLDQAIAKEQEVQKAMKDATFKIEEKSVNPMLIAAVRIHGKFSECGRGFAQIGKHFGRRICGMPFLLHYDCEYKEEDAEFEACMPIKNGTAKDGVAVRELSGGRCVTLMHRGPYEELGRSYAKILDSIHQHGYEIELPTREVYIKGPGMFLRGNPKNYLTEIQMPIRT